MTLVYSEPHRDYQAAHWRNGVILIWTGQVTVDALTGIDEFGQRLAPEHPRYYTVSVNPNGLPFPDGETRTFAGKLVKRREKNVLIAITVLEGSGVFAIAGRAILKAIFALSGGRAHNVVCRDLREAARALAPLVVPKATEAEVLEQLDAVRTQSLARR
jgi:hypothetical protein